MKQTILFLFLIFSSETFACPEFLGSWKSSKDDTLEFIERWAKIEPKSLDFIKQVTGTMHTEYTKESMKITDESRQIEVNGKLVNWEGTKEDVAFEVLGCTDDQVVLKYELFDQDFITVLNFESENIYWVYAGSPGFTGNAHYREFFVRQ